MPSVDSPRDHKKKHESILATKLVLRLLPIYVGDNFDLEVGFTNRVQTTKKRLVCEQYPPSFDTQLTHVTHSASQFFSGAVCVYATSFPDTNPSRCARSCNRRAKCITKRWHRRNAGQRQFNLFSFVVVNRRSPTLLRFGPHIPVTVTFPRLECARSGQSVERNTSAPCRGNSLDTDSLRNAQIYFRTLIGSLSILLRFCWRSFGCCDHVRTIFGTPLRKLLVATS